METCNGIGKMIVDVHGDDAQFAVATIQGMDITPFTALLHASSGEHALEIDDVDRLVMVVNGFQTEREKKSVVKYFEKKRSLPRIIEVNITDESSFRSNLIDASTCPYSSIVYIPTGEDFYQCLTECLASEIVIGLVRDLFGEKPAELVYACLSRVPMDPHSMQVAITYIREAKKFDDRWGDDVPELH
jgi:hypothetical protein